MFDACFAKSSRVGVPAVGDFDRPRSDAAASFTTLRRRSLPLFEPSPLIASRADIVFGASQHVGMPPKIPTPADAALAPTRRRRRSRIFSESSRLTLPSTPEPARRVEDDHRAE